MDRSTAPRDMLPDLDRFEAPPAGAALSAAAAAAAATVGPPPKPKKTLTSSLEFLISTCFIDFAPPPFRHSVRTVGAADITGVLVLIGR